MPYNFFVNFSPIFEFLRFCINVKNKLILTHATSCSAKMSFPWSRARRISARGLRRSGDAGRASPREHSATGGGSEAEDSCNTRKGQHKDRVTVKLNNYNKTRKSNVLKAQ